MKTISRIDVRDCFLNYQKLSFFERNKKIHEIVYGIVTELPPMYSTNIPDAYAVAGLEKSLLSIGITVTASSIPRSTLKHCSVQVEGQKIQYTWPMPAHKAICLTVFLLEDYIREKGPLPLICVEDCA